MGAAQPATMEAMGVAQPLTRGVMGAMQPPMAGIKQFPTIGLTQLHIVEATKQLYVL